MRTVTFICDRCGKSAPIEEANKRGEPRFVVLHSLGRGCEGSINPAPGMKVVELCKACEDATLWFLTTSVLQTDLLNLHNERQELAELLGFSPGNKIPLGSTVLQDKLRELLEKEKK